MEEGSGRGNIHNLLSLFVSGCQGSAKAHVEGSTFSGARDCGIPDGGAVGGGTLELRPGGTGFEWGQEAAALHSAAMRT